MRRKNGMKAILASVLAVGLAACSSGVSSGSEPGGAAAPAKEDTTPVTIQYWHAHAEAQMAGLNYMLDEFKKKYPYITVEPVFQGSYTDLQKKLQAAIAAGDVPAVTNAEVGQVATFADSGAIQDLTSYIKRDKIDLNDFSQGMLKAFAYKNVQYGFPLINSTSVFVYNKSLLDKLGVQPPQKWSEIDAFNKKVAVIENGETKRYAFSVPAWDPWYADPWIINGGGSLLTADGKKTALDQPDAQRFMKLWYDWQKAGYMHSGYGKGASDTMKQMFLDEKIAMVQHTIAVLKMYIENAKFEVGVSFLPGDKKRESNIGGAGIVMMAKAKENQKEAAWKFIQFMTSAEHNIKWAESVGYLPTRKSAVNSEAGKEYAKKWPQYKAVLDNFDNVTPRLQHPAYLEFAKVYTEVLGKLALEKQDPIPLMNAGIKQINDILAEY